MAGQEQIALDEILYRQVGPGGDPIYIEPGRVPPVHRSLFLPSREDSDGLSLIRMKCRSAPWAAFRSEQPETRFRLVNLQTELLVRLGRLCGFDKFEVEPAADVLDEIHGPPIAHCVTREVNRPDYEARSETKKQIKEWALKVADSIDLTQMHGPYPIPSDQVPYRP